jgi:protein SCO1
VRRLLSLLLLAAPAHAALSPERLAQAVARPPADARRPDALAFAENGARETLAQVAGSEPLVLIFADYTCRHICGPGLTLTAGALHDAGLVPGRDYALATIGIDPKDSAADARAMADTRLGALPAERRALHLLTADAATIAAATAKLGYGYAYDDAADAFAHDASVYVFAADGRLAALLPEMGLRPETVRAAVTGAGAPQGLVEQVAHLCYGLAAAHGRFGRPIVIGLQALAAATLLGLGAAFLLRRRRVA